MTRQKEAKESVKEEISREAKPEIDLASIRENKLVIARQMLSIGMKPARISEATGLTKQSILKLKNELERKNVSDR